MRIDELRGVAKGGGVSPSKNPRAIAQGMKRFYKKEMQAMQSGKGERQEDERIQRKLLKMLESTRQLLNG